MPLPFFYSEEINTSTRQLFLNEETSKHVVQVLRMQTGEQLQLTDGRGSVFTAEITDENKKKCAVRIVLASFQASTGTKNTIAISLIKNSARFEWFLEKATEIGVNEIIPLLCTRTEKHHFRYDRMKNILISAMLQSQQAWLPLLHEPVKFSDLLRQYSLSAVKKFIAHCEEGPKEQLGDKLTAAPFERLLLIGPEGDFTKEEILAAEQEDFLPVTLGLNRLRTETAGIVAATILCLNDAV